MFHRYGVAAAAATLLIAVTAHAQSLAPIRSRSIALGPVSGGIYYTVVPEGYRVVATLQAGDPASIVRFIATLAPEQSVTLSTPRGVGEPPLTVQIVRRGNRLLVESSSPTVETKAPVAPAAAAAQRIADGAGN